VAFVFSRRIVGWWAATRMTTDLVLDTLEMAIWSRARDGIEAVAYALNNRSRKTPGPENTR
jgi:transposase InsO family protein